MVLGSATVTTPQILLGASIALNAFAAYANWRVYREQKRGPGEYRG